MTLSTTDPRPVGGGRGLVGGAAGPLVRVQGEEVKRHQVSVAASALALVSSSSSREASTMPSPTSQAIRIRMAVRTVRSERPSTPKLLIARSRTPKTLASRS